MRIKTTGATSTNTNTTEPLWLQTYSSPDPIPAFVSSVERSATSPTSVSLEKNVQVVKVVKGVKEVKDG